MSINFKNNILFRLMSQQSIYRGDLKFKNKLKEVRIASNKYELYMLQYNQLKKELDIREKNKKKMDNVTQLGKQKYKKNQNKIYHLEKYILFLEKKLSRFNYFN